jgi:UDP-galactopyranose mutase
MPTSVRGLQRASRERQRTPRITPRELSIAMSPPHDLVCFSHLRWNFVFQRPQHLLSRAARDHRVYFVEEPVLDGGPPRIELTTSEQGVVVAVPHLPEATPQDLAETWQRLLLDRLVECENLTHAVHWYYTPMALAFTHHLPAHAVVYDCMDELSLFQGAPPALLHREELLLGHADVVFTGGHSLYEYKRRRHHNIHPFPSSVDVPHFARARNALPEPADQVDIPHPRVGFFGVIDERMDLQLLADVADARPDVHLVMIGPVVKIDPASRPMRPNIHWLGGKSYQELPDYLAGWDVAMMPFARNDATRFISPTKTPEYLAAGKPVVSTSIRDVVRPYGEQGLAWIADTGAAFAAAIGNALAEDPVRRQARADEFLSELSWDRTWSEMWDHVEAAIAARSGQQLEAVYAQEQGCSTT